MDDVSQRAPATADHAAPHNPRRDQRILMFAGLAGVALTLIGIRFYLVPDTASRFFGFIGKPNGFQLHAVIAFRDVWLGLLAVGMALFREWRSLTLWLGLGALVCFADAGLVFGAAGRPLSVLFHLFSGVFMTVLAVLSWRRVRRDHP